MSYKLNRSIPLNPHLPRLLTLIKTNTLQKQFQVYFRALKGLLYYRNNSAMSLLTALSITGMYPPRSFATTQKSYIAVILELKKFDKSLS